MNFFSRGLGRGHAMPDIAIAGILRQLVPGVAIRFLSYSTGRRTLVDRGEQVVDLGLDDHSPFVDVLLASCAALRGANGLVVSHEETAAIVAAKIAGLESLYLSHWFPPGGPERDALNHADEIVFMERDGLFPKPADVRTRVSYVGPVLRTLDVDLSARLAYRARAGVGDGDVLLVVLPGSFDESATPIAEVMAQAVTLLEARTHLIWIAGKSRPVVEAALCHLPRVTVLEADWNLERLMVAADVVVTKGTYNLTREARSVGAPTVVLSPGINMIDDLYAKTGDAYHFLWARETSADGLAAVLRRVLDMPRPSADLSLVSGRGPRAVAERIAQQLALPHAV